jgi:hypothetical protein
MPQIIIIFFGHLIRANINLKYESIYFKFMFTRRNISEESYNYCKVITRYCNHASVCVKACNSLCISSGQLKFAVRSNDK